MVGASRKSPCLVIIIIIIITNRKSYRAFKWYQTRWPWMTLNGVIALNAA